MELRHLGRAWRCGAAHWLAQADVARHRDHPRHRHAGGDRVLPAGGAGARQAGGADLRDATGDGRWRPTGRRTCWMPWRWPGQPVRAAWWWSAREPSTARADVAKQHTYRLDAFSSGDAGPIGYVEEGRLRLSRNWPQAGPGLPVRTLQAMSSRKPVAARGDRHEPRRRERRASSMRWSPRASPAWWLRRPATARCTTNWRRRCVEAQAARREDRAGDALRAGQGDRTPR